jgi:nitrogen regulatory protein P-II 1
MKQLDIIVPHERLSEVNKLLSKHNVGGMMFYEIAGRGRAERQPVEDRLTAEAGGYTTGRVYVPDFGTRTKIEAIVSDSLTKTMIDDIIKTLSTGSASDGKVFVKDISEAYDIGAKQVGEVAL